MKTVRRSLALLSLFLLPGWTFALDADDMEELLGYTMVAHSNVRGEFEGADFDKPVALDNGWIFEFTEFNYSYSYRPAVAVFAKEVSVEALRRINPKRTYDRPLTIYKLVIDDEIYDAVRVR